MLHIKLPTEEKRQVSFYLAMEDYIARHCDIDNAFFTWQVDSSVIIGRNQIIDSEVNMTYCQENAIRVFRRKSGGGSVYADMNNLMLSYITKSDNVMFTYHKYTNLVVQALRRQGIKARANGRNDILIGDKKISGNAFYHFPQRSIVHGTLLYDTNLEHMKSSLTPQMEKLHSKGVKSVPHRICLLKDHTELSLSEIRQSIISYVCDEEMLLTSSDVERIKVIEQEYLSPSFIQDNSSRTTLSRSGRIENVGMIEARIELKNNIIKDIQLMGDYFLIGENADICKALKNIPFNAYDLSKALPADLSHIIMNLKREDSVKLLTK
jgi:lipoic acid synthetase/lipoate-protein ligase A